MKSKFILLICSLTLLLSCASKPNASKGDNFGSDGESEMLDESGGVAKNENGGSKDEPKIQVEATALAEAGATLPEKYKSLQSAFRIKDDGGIKDEAAKILTRNPQDVVALNALAVSNLHRNQSRTARYYLEYALNYHKTEPALYNNLAVVEWKEGEIDAAISNLKKAYKINPNHTETLSNLGMIYAKYGESQKAIMLLKEAYKKNKSVQVGAAYALALKMKGDYKESESIYSTIVKADTRDVNILINYSILLIDHLGKPQVAAPLLSRVSFLGTEDPFVQEKLSQLERKLNAGEKQ